jgi:hypothetical protein
MRMHGGVPVFLIYLLHPFLEQQTKLTTADAGESGLVGYETGRWINNEDHELQRVRTFPSAVLQLCRRP